jgi:GT2 family glycosyltransferase
MSFSMKQTTVVIGVPTLNGPDRLWRCLVAINDCTAFDRFASVKILVCDDGSGPGHLETNKNVIARIATHLDKRTTIEMIMHERRQGIATSWNDLTRHYYADVMALLNDDIEVTDNWLDVLVYSVTKNQNVGMVGLNSYASVTKAQVEYAPCAVMNTVRERPHDMVPHAMRPRVDYNEAHLMGGDGTLLASCGYAFAFRREVFDEIGGFDQRYFCYYEETDFGVSLRQKGYHHYMASYPIVYHMGGATNSDKRNLDANAELERSRKLFLDKWGATPAQLRQQFAEDNELKENRDNVLGLRLSSPREWNTQLAFLEE